LQAPLGHGATPAPLGLVGLVLSTRLVPAKAKATNQHRASARRCDGVNMMLRYMARCLFLLPPHESRGVAHEVGNRLRRTTRVRHAAAFATPLRHRVTRRRATPPLRHPPPRHNAAASLRRRRAIRHRATRRRATCRRRSLRRQGSRAKLEVGCEHAGERYRRGVRPEFTAMSSLCTHKASFVGLARPRRNGPGTLGKGPLSASFFQNGARMRPTGITFGPRWGTAFDR
jgi:hypothetical protein